MTDLADIQPAEFVQLVPQVLHPLSGSVFYSGRSAFSAPANLYILGLNPGGSPTRQVEETIGRDLQDWQKLPASWSSYKDESWEGRPAGTCGMQPRMLHMYNRLGLDPRSVPASNVVFVRSKDEAALEHQKWQLLEQCWPVHQQVIDQLGVSTILCLGGTAGRWTRSIMGADQKVGEFVEQNARGWTSEAHLNDLGMAVITVTHPGRADWRNPAADPSPLIQQILNR